MRFWSQKGQGHHSPDLVKVTELSHKFHNIRTLRLTRPSNSTDALSLHGGQYKSRTSHNYHYFCLSFCFLLSMIRINVCNYSHRLHPNSKASWVELCRYSLCKLTGLNISVVFWDTVYRHCVSKNDTDVAQCNFNLHQPTLVIFDRSVAERVFLHLFAVMMNNSRYHRYCHESSSTTNRCRNKYCSLYQ